MIHHLFLIVHQDGSHNLQRMKVEAVPVYKKRTIIKNTIYTITNHFGDTVHECWCDAIDTKTMIVKLMSKVSS
jgi:hypothetical protein